MTRKTTLEQDIEAFLNEFHPTQQTELLRDLYDLFEIYDIEQEGNLDDIVEPEDDRNVRLIRIVYLLSRIADLHANKLLTCKIKFKNLWQRMEKINVETI